MSELVCPHTVTEWNKVRQLFRSEKLEELRECEGILSMWRSRMGEATPIAIICADVLIRVAMKELELKNSPHNAFEMENVKMLYCTCIIRFVNYVSEIEKSRSMAASQMSIVQACSKVGLPSWVVEVRHDASHANMPPIETLRKAFRCCYGWIWTHFWEKSPDVALRRGWRPSQSEEDSTNARNNQMRNVIMKYMTWRPNNKTTSLENMNAHPELRAICKAIREEPREFLRMFCDIGPLIFSKEQMTGVSLEGYEVSPEVQYFWEPVLAYMSEVKLLGELLINILSIGYREPEIIVQINAWARLILVPVLDPDVELFSDMEWNRILRSLLSFGEFADKSLVEKVMDRVPMLSVKRRKQLKRILDISQSDRTMSADDSQNIKTIDDLTNAIKQDTEIKTKKRIGIFIPCDESEFIGVPLGLAPGQHYDSFSLVMTKEYIEGLKANEGQPLEMDQNKMNQLNRLSALMEYSSDDNNDITITIDE